MARNDGIDRTVARNQDLETPADVAKVQEHNEREKDSYLDALEIASERVRAFISAVLARGKETRQLKTPARKRGQDMEI